MELSQWRIRMEQWQRRCPVELRRRELRQRELRPQYQQLHLRELTVGQVLEAVGLRLSNSREGDPSIKLPGETGGADKASH